MIRRRYLAAVGSLERISAASSVLISERKPPSFGWLPYKSFGVEEDKGEVLVRIRTSGASTK
jgi:hypothetical protein